MIENYKNILENVNEIGDSIYKQTLKREFQERIKTTKTKIDTLYNLAFYDIDLVALNFNSLLLKYKEYRNLKKKTFLFTIKVKDYENYYYKTIEEQTAMVNRLKEVNKLLSDTLLILKLDNDITYFNGTLNIIFEKKEDCKTFFKNKIFEQTRDILGFRKFIEILPTYSRSKKNILEAYRNNLCEIKEQERRLNEGKKD